jgi:hypothetical protein
VSAASLVAAWNRSVADVPRCGGRRILGVFSFGLLIAYCLLLYSAGLIGGRNSPPAGIFSAFLMV